MWADNAIVISRRNNQFVDGKKTPGMLENKSMIWKSSEPKTNHFSNTYYNNLFEYIFDCVFSIVF